MSPILMDSIALIEYLFSFLESMSVYFCIYKHIVYYIYLYLYKELINVSFLRIKLTQIYIYSCMPPSYIIIFNKNAITFVCRLLCCSSNNSRANTSSYLNLFEDDQGAVFIFLFLFRI